VVANSICETAHLEAKAFQLLSTYRITGAAENRGMPKHFGHHPPSLKGLIDLPKLWEGEIPRLFSKKNPGW